MFHTLVYRIGVNWISGVMRHLRCSPATGFILLLVDEFAILFMDVLPAEHLLRG
jgi:hypothetical protein